MFERQINAEAVISVVRYGEVIAEYMDDQPYPSFLLLGFVNGNPLHVVGIEQKSKVARIITVYVPEKGMWSEDYKTREKL